MTIVRLLRAPEGEGGPALPPSLSELDTAAGSGGIQSGDGTPKIPDLTETQNQPAGPTSPGTEGGKEGKEEGAAKQEGTNNREEKDGEESDDKVDENKQDEDSDDGEPGEQFFDVVEKITGYHVDVQYPDNVSPESPEGVAIREKAIREKAFDDFEQDLAARNPRGYAFLLHTEAGGSEEEFFRTESVTLPELEKVKESVDVQTNLYRYDLRSRGLDEDTIEALVQKAIKDNKLQDRALTAYQTIDAAQRKQLEDLAKERARQEKQYTDAVTSIRDRVTKSINEDISLVVPEAQKPQFLQYVMDNLQYDPETNKFWIVQELNKEKIKTQLESLFYQHIKGDLSAVVQKKASTKAAQRLRLQVEKAQTGASGGSTGANTQKKTLTLGEI